MYSKYLEDLSLRKTSNWKIRFTCESAEDVGSIPNFVARKPWDLKQFKTFPCVFIPHL